MNVLLIIHLYYDILTFLCSFFDILIYFVLGCASQRNCAAAAHLQLTGQPHLLASICLHPGGGRACPL